MPALLEQFSFSLVTTFMLVMARVGGMFVTTPMFSSLEVPNMVRVWLVVTISSVITPLQFGRLASNPDTLVNLVLLVGGEILIGMILGMGVMILISGIQLTGQIIGQLSGMSLADVFNPMFDAEMPLFSNMLSMLMLAIFIIIGGHRHVIGALLHTFETIHIGAGGNLNSAGEMLVTMLNESALLGIRVSAPSMTALILANVLLGLIGRSMPQLNIMTLGFGVNSLIAMATLSLSLVTVSEMFQDELPYSLQRSVESLENAPSKPTPSASPPNVTLNNQSRSTQLAALQANSL
jgi:flagellar biosynthetic protein FliR